MDGYEFWFLGEIESTTEMQHRNEKLSTEKTRKTRSTEHKCVVQSVFYVSCIESGEIKSDAWTWSVSGILFGE